MAVTEENPAEEQGATPTVAGVSAIWNGEKPTFGIFSHWQCPHCGANLSLESRVCLNACGLSVAAYRRMQRGLAEASRKNGE